MEKETNQGARFVWSSPLWIAVAGGLLGLFANSVVALINGYQDRDVERIKSETEFVLKALTRDPEQSKANLLLLTESGLLANSRSIKIKDYLKKQSKGIGPAIPVMSGHFDSRKFQVGLVAGLCSGAKNAEKCIREHIEGFGSHVSVSQQNAFITEVTGVMKNLQSRP